MTVKNSSQFYVENQGKDHNIEFYHSNPLIDWGFGIVLVKDLNHRFVASNINFMQFSGVDPQSLVGLSDLDMPWAEYADIYKEHEADILSGHNYSVLEPLMGVDKANLLTCKKVIFNKQGIPSGTIATALIYNKSIEYGHLGGEAGKLKIQDYKGMGLTPKESKVLYFILKGFSRTKVAELSGMSTSSYDFHIKNIKLKFCVDNIDDLIYECYVKGLHEIVPFRLLLD